MFFVVVLVVMTEYSSSQIGADDDDVRQIFSCPICSCLVTDVCETICGHIFCGLLM